MLNKTHIDELNCKIRYEIPLTTTSGKIRVKRRSDIYKYGEPLATRQKKFSQHDYIEWQISYDAEHNNLDKLDEEFIDLSHKRFVGANKKNKRLFELSEILYYFSRWGCIQKSDIENTIKFIESAQNDYLIDKHFSISRSSPECKTLFGFSFEKSNVSYPLLIHKLEGGELFIEIVIREKQRAVGVMPMLYVCCPITELTATTPLLGREAHAKETAYFTFDRSKANLVIEIIKIFGVLSASHKHDVLEILHLILNDM